MLVNVYAPNKTPDQCSFYDKLNNYIEEYVANTELRLIVGGDFNVPLNHDFDCSGGNSSRKDSSFIQWIHTLYNNISSCPK